MAMILAYVSLSTTKDEARAERKHKQDMEDRAAEERRKIVEGEPSQEVKDIWDAANAKTRTELPTGDTVITEQGFTIVLDASSGKLDTVGEDGLGTMTSGADSEVLLIPGGELIDGEELIAIASVHTHGHEDHLSGARWSANPEPSKDDYRAFKSYANEYPSFVRDGFPFITIRGNRYYVNTYRDFYIRPPLGDEIPNFNWTR